MSPLTAAVLLLWVVVLVLALACAGLLRQLREVQHDLALLQRSASGVSRRSAVPDVLVPRDGAELTVALLVSPGCEVCEEILPIFLDDVVSRRPRIDPVVLSWDGASVPASRAGVRTVLDTSAYRSVDPGWTPALAVIDRSGAVAGVEPVGSPTAIREVLATVAGSPTGSEA
jgi:hypothetical protein